MNAKSEIYDRIRTATAGAAPPDATPRTYERAPARGPGNADRFAETVDEYRAQVHRVAQQDVAATVRALTSAHTAIVVPPGLPSEWTAEVDVIEDSDMTVDALDTVDAVITGCRVGIAATGTIVLDGESGQGRRALTLVPDHHVCIIRADQVVDTVPQAFAALEATRPLTFISGPSATSDIELNRVEGVHGPRTLDVIIVE
ncbi:lactate utilization protein C [Rhodococcus sp. Leaf7]|uniref:LutC/YkgG family protein n=1 Tax=unclassified Rhodococcus (in: high G+C Gram-positive bacteria) TaxID=192944 RepID=UPI0006FB5957|nr:MULTISPECIES: LUD domain-containing protein [unclassified Rhodococcus (in: high G+C Gram-positive bacteria)]KQU07137.1 lactate utilization protein C [Rhodococcus sp. Leaf7]KQU42655.1 lactate utilization protein C [Rhodococcus sp. Leaf247]